MLTRALSRIVSLPPAPDQRETVLRLLLEREQVEELAVSRARTVADRIGQPVEQTLNQMGVISDEALAAIYAEVSDCRPWDPTAAPVDPAVAELTLSVDFLRQKRLLPLHRSKDRLLVAVCDPLDHEALAGLVFAAGATVEALVATPADWRAGFAAVYGAPEESVSVDERKVDRDVQLVVDTEAEGESARLLARVFETALAKGASDLHFEPRRHDLRIRLRIDGRLIDHQLASADLAASVVTRIKVLASLDLGERRLPQDGRATFVVTGRPIDVRVSTLPSAFGEAVVLRLLDRASAGFDFAGLGFTVRQTQLVDQAIRSPHGIFLVTGPTGSGKTTTLYALLNTLSDTQKKILSIEDPIEYHFAHVVQTQAAPAIGLTFASALRSFLRQDPDVILVGEIRDAETAQVAIQAAMTGHLVLASLHANDAIKVVPRLLDMGVEPYQLAAALVGSLAQRLVRRLCAGCRLERAITAAERAFLGACGAPDTGSTFEAAGCPACGGSGFRGRLALVEGFLCDDALTDAIAHGSPTNALAAQAALVGLASITADGCAKAALGQTSLREVMAAAGS